MVAVVGWTYQVRLYSPSSPFCAAYAYASAAAGERRRRRSIDSSSIVCSEEQRSTVRAIQKCGVIACLRARSAELALETARLALDEGISVAGTVLTCEDAKNAELAGAKFIMSPSTVSEILEVFKDTHTLYIPGAMTPTEVLNAYASGARIVKIR